MTNTFEPTPELRWLNDRGDKRLQQKWVLRSSADRVLTSIAGFAPSTPQAEEWRDVPEVRSGDAE